MSKASPSWTNRSHEARRLVEVTGLDGPLNSCRRLKDGRASRMACQAVLLALCAPLILQTPDVERQPSASHFLLVVLPIVDPEPCAADIRLRSRGLCCNTRWLNMQPFARSSFRRCVEDTSVTSCCLLGAQRLYIMLMSLGSPIQIGPSPVHALDTCSSCV